MCITVFLNVSISFVKKMKTSLVVACSPSLFWLIHVAPGSILVSSCLAHSSSSTKARNPVTSEVTISLGRSGTRYNIVIEGKGPSDNVHVKQE